MVFDDLTPSQAQVHLAVKEFKYNKCHTTLYHPLNIQKLYSIGIYVSVISQIIQAVCQCRFILRRILTFKLHNEIANC
jgi:predicted amidophosphoribosyltransferase